MQSLPAKFNHLTSFVDHLNLSNIQFNILAFQECWKVAKNSFDIPGYNLFFKCRENGNGGGVGCYLKSDYVCNVIEDKKFFVENTFEALAIKVEIPNIKKFIVVSLYRPPNNTAESMENFFQSFNYLCEKLGNFNLPIYIFTDSNINLLNTGDGLYPNILFDTSISNGFMQIISKCTRMSADSKTLIDQIFTSHDLSNVSKSGVIIDSFSDHFMTFCCVKTRRSNNSNSDNKFTFHRNFSAFKKDQFLNDLNVISWDDVYNSSCPNESYNCFWDTFKTLFDLHFPLVRKRVNRNKTPINKFMTSGLLKSRNTKLKLARKAKYHPSPENVERFRTYRNLYNSLVKKAKKLYFSKSLADNHKNSKKIWQVINEACNKRPSSCTIDKLKIGDSIVSDKEIIANSFNDHFADIGIKTTSSIPITNANFRDFLPPPSPYSLFMAPTAPGEILEVILNIDKKTSTDVNDISFNLLQKVAYPISKPLSHIFNLSVEQGIFPEKMKISKTIPIFKKQGSPLEMEFFRGISIVDSFDKIFEKLGSKRLVNFLYESNFFYDNQFGFLKGRSTNHAILKIINFITNAINSGEFTLSIFLDVAKAFDSVDHNILFSKLENAGIRGISLDWFKSFLKDRKQKVKVGNTWSSTLKELNISVLQGSVLGVILFLIFVNDLYMCAPELFKVIFADDLTSLASHSDIEILNQIGNSGIDKLFKWYSANKLAIHPGKSRFMIFKPPYVNLDMLPNDVNQNPYFPLFINTNDIGDNDITKINLIKGIPNETEGSMKVLGVLLDQHLNLQDHVKSLHSKIAKNVYMLNQVKNLLDNNILKLIYFAHIHSHLVYCCNILGMCTANTIKPIQVLQKKAIRIISNASYYAHTPQLFHDNDILPLTELIKYCSCLFMFDYVNGNLPAAFHHSWNENWRVNENRYVLRNANDFNIPRVRYKYLDNHPLYNFSRLWNDLHDDLKSIRVRSKFESALKKSLLEGQLL
jgi:hypothetical protein